MGQSFKLRETEILNGICAYLHIRGVFFWRQNTSPAVTRDRFGGIRFRKMGKWAIPGVPDIFICHDRATVALEVKRPGGRQEDSQKQFELNWINKRANRLYFIAHSIADVVKIMDDLEKGVKWNA